MTLRECNETGATGIRSQGKETATRSGSEQRLVAGRRVRWNEERVRAAYAGGWWIEDTLADALRRAASETPDRTLLVDGDRRIDSATLHREAETLAKAMLMRATPGSVISFMLPNWHEAATVYFAASLAGMIAHPILPSLRESELAFMFVDISSSIIFIPAELRGHDYITMLRKVCAKLERPPEVVVVRGDPRGCTSFDSMRAEQHNVMLPRLDPDAVHMILYTSGTTGTPKGVMHSHNSIHALVRQLGEHWLIEPGDVFLVPSPISHIGGSIYAFELPLLLGTQAVLMDRWEGEAAMAMARRERFTHVAGATPFLEQLLTAARGHGEHLRHLKLFICGGAAVPPALIQSATTWFDSTVVTRVYGSTELPVITVGTIDRDDIAHAAETDGRPGVAEVKLVGHAAATTSDEGEIYARGPQMLVGYVHAEDESGLFDAEGFYRTGDLGRWVDGDFLVVSGRSKDIIIRNGENISPKEIEDALGEHPDVVEAAVVGVPCAATGERACAVIVARTAAKPDVANIAAFLRKQGLANFKLPEQVEIWDSLPKNATGKVLKHAIRAALLAEKGA